MDTHKAENSWRLAFLGQASYPANTQRRNNVVTTLQWRLTTFLRRCVFAGSFGQSSFNGDLYINFQKSRNGLNDDKWPESIECTIVKYWETFYGTWAGCSEDKYTLKQSNECIHRTKTNGREYTFLKEPLFDTSCREKRMASQRGFKYEIVRSFK